ncbi:MAG: ABC transporter permease, partial [Planctomycetota bacterium]
GGLSGVLFGLSVGPIFRLLKRIVTSISPDALPEIVHSLEPRIALWSVILSLVISIGVGVLFGVYPARKAAYLDPIEALRHE